MSSDRDLSPRLDRWRLILGPAAEEQLPHPLEGDDAQRETVLESLYGHEATRRGHREFQRESAGSDAPSHVEPPHWLDQARELFPQSACTRFTQHAIERYGLTDLLDDPEAWDKLEPNVDLLSTLLRHRGELPPRLAPQVRELIGRVVAQLKLRIERPLKNSISGLRHRHRPGRLRTAANFDVHRTIRQNLKHYDPARRAIVIERPSFYSRRTRQLPWHLFLCLDQSASMAESVVYAAVVAGILASLDSLELRIIAFDTSFVDLSAYADDPVELLLRTRLGGGTDIGQAVAYCEQQIQQPTRTLLVILSDFFEGGPPDRLLKSVERLVEAGVTLRGLTALDESSQAWSDAALTHELEQRGMPVSALTPAEWGEWLGDTFQQGHA